MAIDVLSYLEANPRISFDDLKAAYPTYDVGKLRKTYDGFQNTLRTTSNTTNPRDNEPKKTSWFEPFKKVSEIASTALQTQEQSGYMPNLETEAIKASSAFKKLMDNVGNLKNPLLILDDVMNELGDQADL